MATTVIKLTYTLKEIQQKIVWHDLTKKAKTFLRSYIEFRIANHGQELLVYDGNQIVASCGLSQSGMVEDAFRIDNIWTKEGKLF